MLYHLFDWLTNKGIKMPGGGLFQFITFRALMAILLSLIITMIYGKRMIDLLQRKQIGESVRELGLAGEHQKKGHTNHGWHHYPAGHHDPYLLFADLNKVYIRLILLSTVWLGIVGFIDDYLKLQGQENGTAAG